MTYTNTTRGMTRSFLWKKWKTDMG